MSTGARQEEAFDSAAAAFVMRLARALHAYGTPAHRLEQALEAIGGRLGVAGQYLVTPTSIVASIGPAPNPRAFLERVEPGGIDLAKLCQLHRLIGDVGTERMDLATARARLTEIVERKAAHGRFATAMSFGLVSGAAAVFFDGGGREAIAAAAIGLLIGLLTVLSARLPRVALVVPAISGALAAIVAGWSGLLLGPLFPFIPTLAGLIILIPGLTLTIAVNELAHGHLVSGTARLTGAMMTFLQIAFGVALGNRLVLELGGTPASVPPAALPDWTLGVAVLATAVGLMVLFRARRRDLPILVAAVATAFVGSRVGTVFLGPELGVLLGAFLVGSLGYLLARWRGVPSAVGILPGVLPLVPGSLGFRSLSALLSNDVVSGIQAGFTMIVLALSLVTGLLLASFVRRSEDTL